MNYTFSPNADCQNLHPCNSSLVVGYYYFVNKKMFWKIFKMLMAFLDCFFIGVLVFWNRFEDAFALTCIFVCVCVRESVHRVCIKRVCVRCIVYREGVCLDRKGV